MRRLFLVCAFVLGGCVSSCTPNRDAYINCDDDRSCPAGFTCQLGLCVQGSADAGEALPPDAGGQASDAAHTDLFSASDSSEVEDSTPPPDADSLRDSALPDTSPADTTQPDTNLPDTNLPDTNLPDTNLPDTNLPDTNLPDTSPTALTLVNPSFEDDTNQPAGWTGFGEQCGEQIYEIPTFGIGSSTPPPHGGRFYGCAVNWTPMTGGLWQRAADARVGAGYRARVYSYHHLTCFEPGAPTAKSWLGVDPTGGTDPAAATVQWAGPAEQLNSWAPIELTFDANATDVTVFLYYEQDGAGPCEFSFTINYFDLATVEPQ